MTTDGSRSAMRPAMVGVGMSNRASWLWHDVGLLAPGVVLGMFLIERWGRQPEGGYLFTLFDDAAISKTYARTLAQTGELVWFPGADRVEGISNLLWTLVMAGVHAAGFSGSSAALIISVIGLLLLMMNALQVGRLARRLLDGREERELRIVSGIAIVATGTAYPLLFWTLRGFETGLIALLYVLVIHRALDIEERPRGSRGESVLLLGLLTVLLALIRLDALLVPFAALAWMVHRRLLSWTEIVRLIMLITTGLAILFAWRFSYYGSFVPNTYFLKISDAPTLMRLQRGVLVSVKLIPLIALTLLALRADGRSLTRQLVRPERLQLVLLVFGGLVAYSVYVGGDAWEWAGFANRFVAPGLGLAVAVVSVSIVRLVDRPTNGSVARPSVMASLACILYLAAIPVLRVSDLAADRLRSDGDLGSSDWANWFAVRSTTLLWLAAGLSLAVLIVLLRGRDRRVPAAMVAALFLIAATWSASDPVRAWSRASAGVHVVDDAFMVRFGSAIREASTIDARIAIVWAGNLAYYTERPVIDLLGKSDPVIARLNPVMASWRDLYPGHNKWDYGFSIAMLQPDLVAQTWQLTKEDRQNLRSWGYQEWCLGSSLVFIAEQSQRIDRGHFRPPVDGACAFGAG